MQTDRGQVIDLRLPPEDVERLIDRLNRLSEETEGENGRRSQRHFIRGVAITAVAFRPGRELITIGIRLRNISCHGIGFLCAPMLPIGTRLELALPIGQNGLNVQKIAYVKRCQLATGMVHDVGAEFGASPFGPIPGGSS